MSPTDDAQRVSVRAPLALTLVVDASGNQDRVYQAVLLKPGVYMPGIGGGGDRIFFPADVLERLAPSLEGKPVNLEHSTDLADEVGFTRNVRWQDGAIRGDIVLQAKRPKFTEAVGFVDGRLAIKQVPNVSVEFRAPVYVAAQNPGELAAYDKRLVDAKEFQGTAVLSRGACSQDAGCGIGLKDLEAHVLKLGAVWQGTTMPAGDDEHVHDVWIDHGKDWQGKLRTVLWTSEHADASTNVRHTHSWKDATETSTDAGHAHKLPTLPPDLGLTVPGPQGQGQHGEPPMCDEHKALQARVTALEADKKKDADAAALKLQEKANTADDLQKQLTAAQAELKDYRDAEVTALQEAIKEAAPDAKLTELVGDKPTVRDLQLCLKALRVKNPPKDEDDDEAPAAKLGAGRRTKSTDGAAKKEPDVTGDKLVALRARYGVKTGYDKMPPKMRQAVNGMVKSAAKEGRQTA